MLNLFYWIAAIVMLGVLIMLHELGHFWAARATGVRVVEFAVGFGKKLWSRRAKSGVVYSVRILPLGGYCRFVADDEDGMESHPEAYSAQKVWKRALISVAGPLVNFVTAFVLLFLLFAAVGLPGTVAEVGALMEGLPASEAGFIVGDKIISVDGKPVETPEDASLAIAEAGEREILFVVERDGEQMELTVTPAYTVSEGAARLMVGIEYRRVTVRLGLGTSLAASWEQMVYMSRMLYNFVRTLLVSGEGADQLSGPIGLVSAVQEQTAAYGLSAYMNLAASISFQLGLLNLLPIPGLDGSKLIFLAIEKIRGKRMDPNKEGLVILVGFGLMVCLAVFAMYQDITRLLQ